MIIGKKEIINYINNSGGAIGSDSEIENECEKYSNIKTIAFSFKEHNTKSKNKKELSQDELNEGFEHVKIANETLKRDITNISNYVKNLLSRNWFQVKNSDTIFAIGILKRNRKEVNGGTGWCIQQSIDNNKPVYLFEQNINSWFKYEKEIKEFVKINYIPTLTKNFAGVGTRQLNDNGKNAIKKLIQDNLS